MRQSRATNSFSVKAKLRVGDGDADVHGGYQRQLPRCDQYHPCEFAGKRFRPAEDNSALKIAAYVPGANGYTEIDGTGSADGTFTIPGVPPGEVRVHEGNRFYWTDRNDIDTSTAVRGASGCRVPATPVTLKLNVNLATPQTGGQDVYWWSAELWNQDTLWWRPRATLPLFDSRTWLERRDRQLR